MLSTKLPPLPSTIPSLEPSNRVKLKEQCDNFEALLLKYMLDISLKNNNEDDLFPKEAGREIYEDMHRTTIANALSGAFGYSDLLYNYLISQDDINM